MLEDDYDGEYRFDREPVGALQGARARATSRTSGRSSKMLAPGLRLGWAVLPGRPGRAGRRSCARLLADSGSPALDQLALARLHRAAASSTATCGGCACATRTRRERWSRRRWPRELPDGGARHRRRRGRSAPDDACCRGRRRRARCWCSAWDAGRRRLRASRVRRRARSSRSATRTCRSRRSGRRCGRWPRSSAGPARSGSGRRRRRGATPNSRGQQRRRARRTPNVSVAWWPAARKWIPPSRAIVNAALGGLAGEERVEAERRSRRRGGRWPRR